MTVRRAHHGNLDAHVAQSSDAIRPFPFYRGAAFELQSVLDQVNRDLEIRQMMAEVNLQVEKWVRARPEQWLWLHRRWPD